MDMTNCPTCGAPAEVTNRDVRQYEEEHVAWLDGEPVIAWLPGYMEFITVHCLSNRAHLFSGPVDAILERGFNPQQQGGNEVQVDEKEGEAA